MSDRQKLFYALLASAFLHLAIGGVLASWTGRRTADVEPPQPADLSQLKVTIMPQTVSIPTPPPRMVREAVDSDEFTPSKKAPAHPMFESDANMVAGSQLPPSGNLPVPSEAGPNRKFTDFADLQGSVGKGEVSSAQSRARQQAASMPEQTPFAVTQVQHSPSPANPEPTPEPTPTPAPDSLALGTPTPTPSQLPTPGMEVAALASPPPLMETPDVAPTQPEQNAPPEPDLPAPSTQRQTEKTRVNGGIATPGRPGVDAVETPFGRYHRKLSNLIGSRWQLYLQEHPKDVGEVTILVLLDTSGKVTATRVIANHSMDDLAELSTRAILESDLPPVPDDLAPMLRDGKLEITFNFNVYDPNDDSPGR